MRSIGRVMVALSLMGGGLLTGCGPRLDVKLVPPRVPQGGRAVAIAVSQSDAKRLVVASESGGLFRSFDGGVSFQHLDGFPTLFAVDVAMASLDPNVIIATAKDDFAKVSGGGIWRSTDGGVTWKRPAGWQPAGCSGRPGAAGISHMPLTRTFYVATDCGLAVSTDNGASFTTTPLDPTNPMLFSVLVLNRNTGVAADNRRVWFLNNGQWTPSLGGPDAGGTFTPHAFASPWWAAGNIIYHAGRDRRLWVSTTSGGAWRLMLTHCDQLPDGCGNREPFVRAGRALDGDPTHFDVYYGDGFSIFRQTVSVTNPGGNLADWVAPTHMDHRDPADIAFTPDLTEPLMLATDGGVHLTSDQGKNWKLTGSNYGGFVALQIGEVTGRQVEGSTPHLDLYYSTQDNDIKGSSDGGTTWDGSLCCEGAFLQVDRANPAMVDGPVTGRACGGCSLFDAQPHLGQGNPGLFRNAPSGNAGNTDAHAPFQLIGANYLQPVRAPPNAEYWLTGDRGSNWSLSFTLPGTHLGNILFAGDLANPVTYVALEKGSGATLVRASSVSGTPTVRSADSIGMTRIGVMRTAQARYAVVGVDPKNPDHLLAHDVFSGTKASRDGGVSWFPLPALDTVVSDSGRFVPSMNFVPFVTTIAWDPTNSCHILVGTMQNGVIRSADGGRTWARVRGSQLAPYVTSFFFPPTGPIWMSTYGRGLWQVLVDRSPPSSGRCAFPQPPGIVVQPEPPILVFRAGGASRPFTGLRDSAVCPTCTVFLVHDGWITDVEGDAEVRGVATSGGQVEQRRSDGREGPATVANRVRHDENPGLRRRVGRSMVGERHVRGLVLDGRRLVAYVVSSAQLPIAPLRAPTVFVRALADDSVQVLGFHFLPGAGEQGVTVLVEGDTLASGVPVGADGRFDTRVRLRRAPGWVTVTAAQRDGLRTTLATTDLQVTDR
jgi:photosystem II stability/assembly factor-like uncharacterized protein